MKTAEQWIDELNLQPHPEGGFFLQTDISSQSSLKNGKKFPLYTNIYFLLTKDSPSHFHQLTSDELWFFHDGSPLTIHSLNNDGSYSHVKLGLARANEEQLHYNVPAGTIFGSTVEESYALVSCTVIPGFDFSDFKLFTQTELLEKYPAHHEIISRLTYEALPK